MRATPQSRYRNERVGVWMLSEMSYCEQRLDLSLDDPGSSVSVPGSLTPPEAAAAQETLGLLRGKMAHAALQGAAERLPAAGPEDEAIQSEQRLVGAYNGLEIIGKPDLVYLTKDRTAGWVVDYKSGDYQRLQEDHRTQLVLYGYLIEQRGDPFEGNWMGCVYLGVHHSKTLKSGGLAATRLFKSMLREVRLALDSPPDRKQFRITLRLHGGPATLCGVRYQRAEALAILEKAHTFWHGERLPRPTDNPRKCKSCPYNKLGRCSVARAEFEDVTLRVR